MTVIRVEHPESGKGVWHHKRGEIMIDLLWEMHMRHNNFNGRAQDFPDDDMSGEELDKYFCAYKSIEQIQEWIKPDEFKVIIENGFNILLIDVSQYKAGRDQVFFKKEHVTQTKIINDLFFKKEKSIES